jgi:hypothetical protein
LHVGAPAPQRDASRKTGCAQPRCDENGCAHHRPPAGTENGRGRILSRSSGCGLDMSITTLPMARGDVSLGVNPGPGSRPVSRGESTFPGRQLRRRRRAKPEREAAGRRACTAFRQRSTGTEAAAIGSPLYYRLVNPVSASSQGDRAAHSGGTIPPRPERTVPAVNAPIRNGEPRQSARPSRRC